MYFSTSQGIEAAKFATLFDKSSNYIVEKVNSFSERLRLVAVKYNLSFSDLALKLGVPKGTLHGYWNEDREPKLSFFETFSEKFPEEDVQWLITGKSKVIELRASYEELNERYKNVVEEELTLYKRLDALTQENIKLKLK
jgi:transcriptional regulator with XRE-family HTH domain